MFQLRPATERILGSLPGPADPWIVAWMLIPWLNAGANLLLETGARSAVWEQSRTLVLLSYAAVSCAVGITLWGTTRVARRMETLRAKTFDVLEGDEREPFREVNSIAGPIAASAVTAIAFAVTALVDDGWTAAILRGGTWFVVGIPLWTFLWTYGALQLGLDRLGRERLRPEAARLDPTLGLQPLGAAAFTGLWLLVAWLLPVLLTGLPDVVGVVLGVAVLGGALATFFLSLLRLHRQMVEVKASELAIARDLYAEAYAPLRAAPTLETLERQRGLLSAAEALEKRAREIHEWPIDEGTMARVLTIATSVVAITIGRLILGPLGL
jgi:hypothetical protein